MDIDESDGQIESDELLTASESSDDESTPQNKYPHFNEMAGFSKQIELEKGTARQKFQLIVKLFIVHGEFLPRGLAMEKEEEVSCQDLVSS
ncbi:hypothetical protein QQ045_005069 [Rhodiola kirilowii]